jgi:hypothetical protein
MAQSSWASSGSKFEGVPQSLALCLASGKIRVHVLWPFVALNCSKSPGVPQGPGFGGRTTWHSWVQIGTQSSTRLEHFFKGLFSIKLYKVLEVRFIREFSM